MTKRLTDIMKDLPTERRERVEARADELIAEMTLSDLRKARDLTQERMAEALEIGQDGVSRLERRSDKVCDTTPRDPEKDQGGRDR